LIAVPPPVHAAKPWKRHAKRSNEDFIATLDESESVHSLRPDYGLIFVLIDATNMPTEKADPYDFDNERGWRAYRVLRPGRGMYHDVKRRLPYYRSDITDAWTYRTFAATVRIYFVKLAFPNSPRTSIY